MTDESPTPPGQAAGKPRGRQLLVLVFGGLALGFGGCFMAIVTWNQPPMYLFGAAFVAGSLMFIAGVVGSLVVGIKALVRRSRAR
jgi:hypothetical protein